MKQVKKACVVYILTKLELGGAQKICLALVEGMQTAVRDTCLITGAEGVLVGTVAEKPNVTMLSSLRPELSMSGIMADLACCKALIQQLRIYKKQYRHLIIHTHSSKAGALGRFVGWMLRIPVVHTIHGYGFHEQQPILAWWLIYCIELVASCWTTHYICVSRADAKTGTRLFPSFKRKHTIIRAAVDEKKFQRPLKEAPLFAYAPTPFIFGTISCFKPQKNLNHLIRAFSYVNVIMPHARLEIIGDGAMRAELEELISSLHLTSSVTLHGWQHNVVEHMKRWHTFVLSSLWEGLPCAIVEARLLHIPVVCYDTGGISEVIIHNKNGLLVPRHNWQMLGEYMLAIISQPNLYERFQWHEDHLDEFFYETMLKEHDEVYKTIEDATALN